MIVNNEILKQYLSSFYNNSLYNINMTELID